ncbi:MAG: DUF2585 family protein [Sphingomicrobium sp.]
MVAAMTLPRRSTLAAAAVVLAAALILLALGRAPICTCGTVKLWVAARDSSETSQMIADWYSASHIVHGLLFYAALRLVCPRWPVEWRFVLALGLEAAWEVLENTPLIIDRYREATAAFGYNGDSIVNSLSDVAMMGVGFLAARKLPLWGAIVMVLALELVPLVAIRDNLTLNIWMLLAPNQAIAAWQASG